MLIGLCAVGMSLAACEEDSSPDLELEDASVTDDPSARGGADGGDTSVLDAGSRSDAGARDAGASSSGDAGAARDGGMSVATDAGTNGGLPALPGLDTLFGDGGLLTGILPDPAVLLGDAGLGGLIPGLGGPPPDDAGTAP
jgi:hypothetical protein